MSARLISARRPATLAFVLFAGLGAWASAVAGAPAPASAQSGGSPPQSETGGAGQPGESASMSAAGTWCQTLGRLVSSPGGVPVQLVAGVGSTQATRVGAGFALRLAVTATDAQGNPAAGALVKFAAPLHGASGWFAERSASGRARASRGRGARVSRHRRSHVHLHRTVEVRTDACGIAVAPPFIANRVQGGYVVKATAGHAMPAAFALVNEAR